MAKDNNGKKTVADIVTENIIKRIEEENAVPWRKPWKDTSCINWETGNEYTGVNRIMLMSGEYLTFKRLVANRFNLNKGAKSHLIVRVVRKNIPMEKFGKEFERFISFMKSYFNGIPEVKNGTDEYILNFAIKRGLAGYTKNSRLVSYSKSIVYHLVYNINDMTTWDGKPIPSKFETGEVQFVQLATPEQAIKDYVSREKIELVYGDKASYSSMFDRITMPKFSTFISAEEYYSTFFHEIGHSTGHRSRLNRPLGTGFGSELYSFEELVAEITASIVCHETGILQYCKPLEDNSVAYIRSWLNALKADTSAIIKAASFAEKAKDYIFNYSTDSAENDNDNEE